MPPQPSPRASLIQRLANEVGLETLAAIEVQAVRHRPPPNKLVARLLASDKAQELSPRQYEVVLLLAGGLSRKEIAKILGIGEETVKTHIQHAYLRAGVSNRIELLNYLMDVHDLPR